VNLILTTLLLVALGVLCKRRETFIWGNSKPIHFLVICSALIFMLFVLGNETHHSGEYMAGRGFTKLVGEFVSITLLWIGFLLLPLDVRIPSLRQSFISGLVLGLAILTKLVVLISAAAFLTIYFMRSPLNFKRILLQAVVLFSAMAIPTAAFEGWKVAALGRHEYHELKHRESEYFAIAGSGVSAFKNFQELKTNLRRNWTFLYSHFGYRQYFFCFALWLAFLFFSQLKRYRQAGYWFIALSMAGLANVVWWILFSPTGLIRHAFTGILTLGFFALLATIREWSLLNRYARAFIVILSAGYGTSQIGVFQNLYADISRNDRLEHYFQTLSFLEANKDKGEFFGCGFWFHSDLEYGLKGVNNFRDCLGKDFVPSSPDRGTYLVQSDFFDWEKNPRVHSFIEQCNVNTVFQSGPFRIGRCEGKIEAGAN
jgi:hypothetical protein